MPSGVRSAVLRILLIEDDDDLRDSLVEDLTGIGHSVRGARNGVEGLELATAHRFDCILLDVGLPGLHGHEVARRVRERGFRGAIIAVSGFVRESDRKAAREAGCDAYLIKPVDLKLLHDSIRAFTHRAKFASVR